MSNVSQVAEIGISIERNEQKVKYECNLHEELRRLQCAISIPTQSGFDGTENIKIDQYV